jgi:hypothetical protein
MNFSAGTTLRSFLAGGSYVKPGAAGASRNIPASGTINVRDFISAEEIGLYNNTAISFSDSSSLIETAVEANCVIDVNGTGAFGSFDAVDTFENWMKRKLGADSSTNTQYFDVLFNRTAASGYDTTLYGNAANTWYQCGSTDQKWWIKAYRASIGTASSTASGYLAFRRRSDNVVVQNVAVTLTATATVNPAPDTK